MVVLFFFRVILSLFSSSPLALGLKLLFSSIILALYISFIYLSWFSIIFFLVFIRGLLVLLFYILSLSYNPISMGLTNPFSFLLILLSIELVPQVYFENYYKQKNNTQDTRWKLFNYSEVWFKSLVILFLFFILWVVTKVVYQVQGALRPFF